MYFYSLTIVPPYLAKQGEMVHSFHLRIAVVTVDNKYGLIKS